MEVASLNLPSKLMLGSNNWFSSQTDTLDGYVDMTLALDEDADVFKELLEVIHESTHCSFLNTPEPLSFLPFLCNVL